MENNLYDFGMIGLGTMGRNLLLNMADHGFKAIGFDLDPAKGKLLETSASPGTMVKGVNTLAEMVQQLQTPRKIMMLVPAGKPVDNVINSLLPLVSPGDIIIDGGNSHYIDTLTRVNYVREKGFHFMGIGISGGEHGARTGPSIMPGGDTEAYEKVKHILEAVSAKVNGSACVAYLGNGAAGHYVKMVHNGIEYAIMQLISETYQLLHMGKGLSNDELHKVYKIWNEMVPREGPAPTVQGELLRSIEKLREEAQQHANTHYRKTHKRMAVFLRDTLIGSGIFDKTEKERIRSEAGRLMRAGKPVVDDQLYETRTPMDLTTQKWVYEHPHFLLLNLAVGGRFPMNPDNSTPFPQTLLVDYVRIYTRAPTK